MSNRISSIGLAAILIAGLFVVETLHSQPAESQEHTRRITPELEAEWRAKLPYKVLPPSAQSSTSNRDGHTELLDFSYYDYAENTGRMLALTPGGVHIVYSALLSAGEALHARYNFFDESISLLFGGANIDYTLATTGRGRVLNGKNEEAVICFHGGGNWLYHDQLQAGYSFTNMLASGSQVFQGSYPGIALNPATDEIWYVGASPAGGDSIPDSFYYSNDYGATFTQMTFPSFFPQSIPVNESVWPVLNPANSSQVAFALIESDPIGMRCNVLSWHVTADNGASWTSRVLYDDSKWFSDPDGNYRYLISNFSQYNSMYTDDGTFHIVFNGYGLVDSANVGDTLSIFPIVYWNSNTQQFVELTDPEVGHNIDGNFSRAILNGYPGNGIGNAYPTIATNPSTHVLVVLWQQVEVDANGLPIIATDTSGNPSGFYATDIWAAVSPNNGSGWYSPFRIAGRPGQSDVFPTMARETRVEGIWDSLYIYFYYYEDPEPGVSLFGEGDVVEGKWIFKKMGFPLPIVDEAPASAEYIPQEFELKQNYPNPFNPCTVISWQLAVGSHVELAIYNLLGQRVRTLVNTIWPAGSHKVEWDGKDNAGKELASGIYIYRLQTAEFISSRKMLLLR